jgi:hypothetical protein
MEPAGVGAAEGEADHPRVDSRSEDTDAGSTLTAHIKQNRPIT